MVILKGVFTRMLVHSKCKGGGGGVSNRVMWKPIANVNDQLTMTTPRGTISAVIPV